MATQDPSPSRPIDVRSGLLQVLESLHGAGVQQWRRPRATPELPAVAGPRVNLPTRGNPQPAAGPVVGPDRLPAAAAPATPAAIAPPSAKYDEDEMAKGTESGRLRALTRLQQEVAACTLCPELVANRTQTVFGVGNLRPRLVFFGEAPGADEDRQGEPFVGAAGQLLNDIITKGMKLQRSDVYILNVLKCRPPANRPPEPAEAAHCSRFWRAQLEILQPEFVCCLGLHAAQQMLNTKLSVGKLRGRLHECGRIKVLVTYHPAYLLRNPPAKKDVWADIKILMREMGLKVD